MLQTWWDTTLSRFGSGRWHQYWTYSHSWFLEMCSCRIHLPFGNQSSQVEVSGSPFLSGCQPESQFAVSLHFRLGSIPWLLPCQRCCHCWQQPEKRAKNIKFILYFHILSYKCKWLNVVFDRLFNWCVQSPAGCLGRLVHFHRYHRAIWKTVDRLHILKY